MSASTKFAEPSHNLDSFPPFLTEYDLYLFGKGDHHKIYEKMGAHLRTTEGIKGVNFAVWAPDAKKVNVVGDFNGWDGKENPMRNRGNSGVWEVFIPHLGKGELYKYEIITKHNQTLLKADPYAIFCQTRPKTASIVWNIDSYRWGDEEWMRKRDSKNPLDDPISVYEVHPGSWRV
jgi:1,4-alpha-glucan branching enzyme